MGRNITETGDKTLKPCSFNDILIIESARALQRVTMSNNIVINNPVQLTAVIEDYSSDIK